MTEKPINQNYESFRNHSFIQTIAGNKKWTVATDKKMPIDMRQLIDHMDIQGAVFNDKQSLTDLDELNFHLPHAKNYTYYLDAVTDRFVVLDIEPSCPDNIRKTLLNMQCLYSEISMSGKGVHMVFPLPYDILVKYPAAQQKIVFKHPKKWYEILLNHYITFTGRQLQVTPKQPITALYNLFEEMAQTQTVISKENICLTELKPVETKHTEFIFELLRHAATNQFKKTLQDYCGDNSSYEFGYISFLNNKLCQILKISEIAEDRVYTPTERAWFLYIVATECIPRRPKHEQLRNNMPWLLYLVKEVMSCEGNQS